jgi:hypothetical protein
MLMIPRNLTMPVNIQAVALDIITTISMGIGISDSCSHSTREVSH